VEQTAGLASPPPGTRAAQRGPVAAVLERGGGPFGEWPGRRESKTQGSRTMQSNRQFWEEQGEAWKPMSAKDKNGGKKKKKEEEEEKAKKEPNLEAGEEDAPLLVSSLVGAGRRLHLRAACS